MDKGLQEGERYKAKEEEERKENAGIYQGITTTSPSQQRQSQASPKPSIADTIFPIGPKPWTHHKSGVKLPTKPWRSD
jgi:hypothetical protein